MGSLDDFKAELIALLPRLQRYARNSSFSESDAEELLQATCLRALEKHSQYQPGTNFDRWAFTIMSSVRKNHLRSIRPQESLSEVEHTLISTDNNEANTLHAQILAKLHTLPLAQKQVMLLVYVEGFSYQEAADIIDVPIGTVMSRIARARTTLAERLQ